jgi:glyoxalase family protein
MAPSVNGLHHITAIAGAPQENLDFYAGVLGMRLVKRSVNQDDPSTYHLFYADAVGHPGSDLTFFPWMLAAPPRMGHGLAVEVGLEIPLGTPDFWAARLERYGVTYRSERRFGDRTLTFADPHGMAVALVEPAEAPARDFTPWDGGPVGHTRQIRGLHGARVWQRDAAPSIEFLTTALGLQPFGQEGEWQRFGSSGGAGVIDVRETPHERRGAWGIGAVHHLAWRVDDDVHQQAVRNTVAAAGATPTGVIDRFWFRSVYFREPGGVLFELATDGPGFGVDEDAAHLGEALVLPPFLEGLRPSIEQQLPSLVMPHASEGGR